MARYVVLSFEDNDEAELFVDATINDEAYTLSVSTSVLGVYAQPTQFCDFMHPKVKRNQAWSFGKKFGWMICTTCNKPSGKGLPPDRLFKVVLRTAKNLLEVKQDA